MSKEHRFLCALDIYAFWCIYDALKLSQTLNDIDFDLENYQKYKLTNEGSLFLQYDNKKNIEEY